ncbi:MAG: hypothetical protein QHH06_05120 [Clostridiales bacterium]|jgi:hypothetical protein|nr:hypothetical protein [Eubacteriales bacterium]MDH7565849.1 hypothetical protein [Clostridiales bacterium]
MHNFDRIPPNQFALVAALLGILLNLELDINEQNSFGNFLVSVGQTMLTAAAQAQNQTAHPTRSSLCQRIDQMRAELDMLKKQLKS